MFTALVAAALASVANDTSPRIVDVRSEYQQIYHLIPDADSTQGFRFRADSLPSSDLLAPIINPNLLFFDYMATWGTTPRLTELSRTRLGQTLARDFAALLQRDTTFNSAFMGVTGRWFAMRGIRVQGWDASRPREQVQLQDVMALAARFFYPAAVRADGSIETHICIAAEGLGDLQRHRNLALEALIFAAIRHEVATPRFGLRPAFNEIAARMNRADLSSDSSVRLARAQGFLWAELARSPALQATVLSEYRSLRDVLPFEISDVPPLSVAQATHSSERPARDH